MSYSNIATLTYLAAKTGWEVTSTLNNVSTWCIGLALFDFTLPRIEKQNFQRYPKRLQSYLSRALFNLKVAWKSLRVHD